MRWGQLGVALAFAIAAAWYVYLSTGIVTSSAIAAITFIIVRWTFSIYYRIKYHVHFADKRSTKCRGCRKRIWKIKGDWMLECKECGWKPGWPVLRWLLHSVPARQFRRTLASPSLIIVLIAVALIASGAAADYDDRGDGIIEIIMENDFDGAYSQPNETRAQELTVELINEERSQSATETIEVHADLTMAAREHSSDMADRDFYGHTNPDGEEPWDRVDGAEECKIHGEHVVSENIHYSELHRNAQSIGSPNSFDTRTTEGIANFTVDGWMYSDGHRKNMLDQDWEYLGVGVVIQDDHFYVTAKFC